MRRTGLAGRLMVAQGLVLVAMALTTWIVSSAVAPSIFHDHLRRAGMMQTGSETEHVEEAFWSALLVGLAVSLLIAVAAALAVSAYFSRRVQRSVAAVTTVAGQIGAGQHSARVADPGLGEEFATLSETINSLAARLESSEIARRRMLSDLAHEMRTPLATIDAHLEAVEDGVRALDRSTLEVIGSSTGRLRRLAEDIGAVSRAEEGRLAIDRRRVAAAEIARDAAAAALDRYDARGVALRVEAEGEPVVLADPDRIGQVLANLLDNALRHTPAGGTVTLSCRPHAGGAAYAVTDTGSGIAAEHLDHLFDRFYRADTARDRLHGGSGIGLSIAKALVEAHGGAIGARSAGPGHGATFWVRVPGEAR